MSPKHLKKYIFGHPAMSYVVLLERWGDGRVGNNICWTLGYSRSGIGISQIHQNSPKFGLTFLVGSRAYVVQK